MTGSRDGIVDGVSPSSAGTHECMCGAPRSMHDVSAQGPEAVITTGFSQGDDSQLHSRDAFVAAVAAETSRSSLPGAGVGDPKTSRLATGCCRAP